MVSKSKILSVSALAVFSLALAGCENPRGTLGLDNKKAPDEFSVITKAPLIIPPDFSLRPPSPGQAGPREQIARTNARSALFGRKSSAGAISQSEARAAGTSAGELALLRNADAVDADDSIRALVNQETNVLAEEDKTVIERIMFWQEQPAYGTVVDPTKEKQRIQENAALGNDAGAGGETPTIERRKKALLEGLFD